MKLVLGTLSIINGLMGLTLLGLFALADGDPAIVAGLGVGLLIQGGYTLAYMGGLFDAFEPWSLRALIAFQAAAALWVFAIRQRPERLRVPQS